MHEHAINKMESRGAVWYVLCIMKCITSQHVTHQGRKGRITWKVPPFCEFSEATNSLSCRMFNITRFPELDRSIGNSLDTLRIVHSYFYENRIDRSVFVNVSSVRVLKLDFCHLTSIAEDTFADFTNLEHLSLSWMPLNDISMANALCSVPTHNITVEFAGIFRNGMDQPFPNVFFECLSGHVTSLDFSANKVDQGTLEDLFCALRNSSVIKLADVTFGKSLTMTSDFFMCLNGSTVRELDIQGNSLSSLTEESFNNLQSLVSLDLSSCQLAKLVTSMDVFSRMTSLVNLSLRNNNFKDFEIFSNVSQGVLSNLKYIDLSGNKFWWILDFKGYNQTLPALETLIINDNDYVIDKIPDDCFLHLPSLKELQLNRNRLYKVREIGFRSATLEHLELIRIVINLNMIRTGLFQNASNLRRLSLEQMNKDSPVPLQQRTENTNAFFKKAFQHLTKLSWLNLKEIGLNILTSCMFLGTNRLQFLDLSYNYIHQLGDSLVNVNEIRELRLDHNLINTVNQTWLPNSKGTFHISLSFNPWTCDCSLYWFRQQMDDRYHASIIVDGDKETYICDAPAVANGQRLMTSIPNWTECHSSPLDPRFYAALIVSVLICLTALSASIVYKYRWRIYFCYINRRAWVRQYRLVNDTDDYQYDAFVAYNNNDTYFVASILRGILEDEFNFNICLHDRDWLGGIDIVDNIQQSIDKSRKVVLIITNAFAKSNWCQFELTMAQHRLFSKDRDNLILVMKEKILDCNMTPRLALQLKTQTYIEWDESEMGQKVFWARLKRSLEANTKSVKDTPV